MLKTLVYSTAQWAGHEAKRLHSKLKKIDATGGPAITLAGTPTSRPMPGSNRGLLRLGHHVSNQWR